MSSQFGAILGQWESSALLDNIIVWDPFDLAAHAQSWQWKWIKVYTKCCYIKWIRNGTRKLYFNLLYLCKCKWNKSDINTFFSHWMLTKWDRLSKTWQYFLFECKNFSWMLLCYHSHKFIFFVVLKFLKFTGRFNRHWDTGKTDDLIIQC